MKINSIYYREDISMKTSERSTSNSRIKLLENINTPGKYNFDYSLRNKNQDAQNSLPPTDKASCIPKNGFKNKNNNFNKVNNRLNCFNRI